MKLTHFLSTLFMTLITLFSTVPVHGGLAEVTQYEQLDKLFKNRKKKYRQNNNLNLNGQAAVTYKGECYSEEEQNKPITTMIQFFAKNKGGVINPHRVLIYSNNEFQSLKQSSQIQKGIYYEYADYKTIFGNKAKIEIHNPDTSQSDGFIALIKAEEQYLCYLRLKPVTNTDNSTSEKVTLK
jgi:hypothetical protein